jgi:hypothetical protein
MCKRRLGVQLLQNPPLCSSTILELFCKGFTWWNCPAYLVLTRGSPSHVVSSPSLPDNNWCLWTCGRGWGSVASTFQHFSALLIGNVVCWQNLLKLKQVLNKFKLSNNYSAEMSFHGKYRTLLLLKKCSPEIWGLVPTLSSRPLFLSAPLELRGRYFDPWQHKGGAERVQHKVLT